MTRPKSWPTPPTIAHRTVKLSNRHANVGAMLVREQAMQMRDQVGDGSATAAVLTRAMVRTGMRMVAAGASPHILQRGMERAVRAAVAELKAGRAAARIARNDWRGRARR